MLPIEGEVEGVCLEPLHVLDFLNFLQVAANGLYVTDIMHAKVDFSRK